MRKFLYILFVSLGFLMSCEEDLVIFDEGDGFIQVERTSASTSEDGAPMSTTISLGTETNDSGISVNFDVIIESGDASRFTITPANGVLDIPAGEFSGEIVVTPIDNIDADGNAVIRVELSESNPLPIGVGGLGLERTGATFTINDNDCPTEISESYRVNVFAFGAEAPAHSVALIPVAGTDNQWTVTSAWGPEFVAWATGDPGFSGAFPYSGTIVLNDDFSVEFIGDAAWATGGIGSYSACDDQFTITLTQALFTTAFTVDIVMTGQ
ncbi:hypothetical protein [Robiginitalea marina]|uniref:Calx-beta domain-containing protein n=1 Tax=Robiginitalea marina TaxID=2954105 RepID=A0ABT1B2U8_9FLAO|nr:hypothetical protein [Robiginitalea marina]MCO5725933.1 hypothetical protein [Robiginitalea marina]